MRVVGELPPGERASTRPPPSRGLPGPPPGPHQPGVFLGLHPAPTRLGSSWAHEAGRGNGALGVQRPEGAPTGVGGRSSLAHLFNRGPCPSRGALGTGVW